MTHPTASSVSFVLVMVDVAVVLLLNPASCAPAPASFSFAIPIPDHSTHNHAHSSPPQSAPPPPISSSSSSVAAPVTTSYGNPRANPLQVRNDFVYTPFGQSTSQSGFPSSPSSTSAAAEPIPIIRSEYNAPTGPSSPWNYSFETGNGIRQTVEGTVRSLGDEAPFVVMRGSYSYTGPDGREYVVDWFADETGFHPSAPHLPEPVEIPFPEQAAAVAEQIRFAREQESGGSGLLGEGGSAPGGLGGGDELPSYIATF